MILNLTQHEATPEQTADGVVEPENKEFVKDCLTFKKKPTPNDIYIAISALVSVAKEWQDSGTDEHSRNDVMIGGAPYLMAPLATLLTRRGLNPVYAYSERVSAEVVQPDGSVVKTSVFKHMGFVGL